MKKNKIFISVFIIFLISNSFVANANASFLESGDTAGGALDGTPENYEIRRLDVSNEEDKPYGMTFNNDGTKMFMVGEGSGDDEVADDIHEYILSTPYDVSTASFRVGLNAHGVTSKTLRQIEFNKDGSRMFVAARSGGCLLYTSDAADDP